MSIEGAIEPRSIRYRVEFVPYAQRHYLKRYAKKYGKAWDVTRIALEKQFERIESLVLNNRTGKPIRKSADNRYWLIKHEFAVAGTKRSPKGSGNRAIISVDRNARVVYVLMVYHKNDLGAAQRAETATWQRLVQENCSEWLEWFD